MSAVLKFAQGDLVQDLTVDAVMPVHDFHVFELLEPLLMMMLFRLLVWYDLDLAIDVQYNDRPSAIEIKERLPS